MSRDNPLLAQCLNDLGKALKQAGNYFIALQFYQQAEAIYRRSGETQVDNLAINLHNQGRLHFDLRDFYQSILAYRKALEVIGGHYDCSTEIEQCRFPLVEAAIYNSIGELYLQFYQSDRRRLENAQRADCYLKRALNLRKENREPDKNFMATTQNDLGTLKILEDKPDEAFPYFEEARDYRESRNIQGIDTDTATIYHNLSLYWETVVSGFSVQ